MQGRPKEDIETELRFIPLVKAIAEDFVRGTPFEEKVTVNQQPLEDHVNIYFLREDPEHLTPRFRENCCYIGYQNAILCDANFIASVFNSLERFECERLAERSHGADFSQRLAAHEDPG